jgi:hypothetical protein
VGKVYCASEHELRPSVTVRGLQTREQ